MNGGGGVGARRAAAGAGVAAAGGLRPRRQLLSRDDVDAHDGARISAHAGGRRHHRRAKERGDKGDHAAACGAHASAERASVRMPDGIAEQRGVLRPWAADNANGCVRVIKRKAGHTLVSRHPGARAGGANTAHALPLQVPAARRCARVPLLARPVVTFRRNALPLIRTFHCRCASGRPPPPPPFSDRRAQRALVRAAPAGTAHPERARERDAGDIAWWCRGDVAVGDHVVNRAHGVLEFRARRAARAGRRARRRARTRLHSGERRRGSALWDAAVRMRYRLRRRRAPAEGARGRDARVCAHGLRRGDG